jgi:hydrophobe/amphiphile efflux-1 (HAE1) family protein
MLNLALVVFGIVGLSRLPVRELPDIDAPIVNVTTLYPGAAPEVVETEITERLEAAINGIEGIRRLSSNSREQSSSITIEFTADRDIDLAANDVRDRVARVRRSLPEDAYDPVVAKQDADARPIMWVALYSDTVDRITLTDIAENVFRERLQTVPGVSSIMVGGAKRYAVRVRLKRDRLAAYGLTVADVDRAMAAWNVELPSGRVEGDERELAIRTRGQLDTPEAFAQLAVAQRGERTLRLGDIAEVFGGVEDERGVARYRGRPAVGLGIVRQSKANTIEVAQGAKAVVAELMTQYGDSITHFVAYDESVYVERSIRDVAWTLALAFVLVVLTIFAFLGSSRATVVPALTIPVSVISTFFILFVLGFSVNIVTMLALVLAIGLVVDDSIVVLENVHRHIEDGDPPLEAATTAMGEIGFAVIATTISLVAVFVPMAFQTSTTGLLFVEFALALAGSVVVSTFVALTLAPAVAARVLKKRDADHRTPRWQAAFERALANLTERYTALLERALAKPGRTVGITAAVVVLGLLAFWRLDSEFLPEEDKGRLFAVVIAPRGATPEYTDRMVRKIEAILLETPEVAGFFAAVAMSGSRPGEGAEGMVFMRLADGPRKSAQALVRGPGGLAERLNREVEGALTIVSLPKAIGGGRSQPWELVLQHGDLDVLAETSTKVANALREAGYLIGVRPTFQLDKPQLDVTIDRDRAAQLGVSVEDIARSLQVLFGGLAMSSIQRGGKSYDVIVDLERDERATPSDIGGLTLRTRDGSVIPLSGLVDMRELAGPSSIRRLDRLRSASIDARPDGISLGESVARTEALLPALLPPGMTWRWDSEVRDLAETGNDMLFVILLAILIVYMTLAAQFESLAHPLTVMSAMPLGLAGATIALWLVSGVDDLGVWLSAQGGALASLGFRIPAMSLNLFSMIGFILLIGLVTKNSILLVEFANQRRAQGLEPAAAMLDAARLRLRPILMTAVSTIAGILPIALGMGAGAESRRPLGIVVVGGMATSTVLTLVIVPLLYVGAARLAVRRRRTGGAA